MLGSFFVWLAYKDHFAATDNGGLKAASFYTSPALKNTKLNLLSEALGTFVLIMADFYITNGELNNGDEHTPSGSGPIGAIPVTFIVWSIGLSLGGTTGYAINPARDLGPRIMYSLLPISGKNKKDWRYSWIPVVGPVLGCALAAGLYLVLNG